MIRPVSAAILKERIPGLKMPAYDRQLVRPGIVHLGAGAFHRAHQAAYLDDLLSHDPRWGLTSVSLRSPDVQTALTPQSCLYTLVLKGETSQARLIGSIGEILLATRQGEDVIARMAAIETGLITLTVTEKGYCLDEQGQLDFNHPDIVQDLSRPHAPKSAIGYLVAGLALRRSLSRAQGTPPPVILSCDNLPENGRKLAAAVIAFAGRIDAELGRWIGDQVRFPSSMVDSITPATDAALREDVRDRFGLIDAWPIQREPFTAWVIEDLPDARLPDFTSVGAQLTTDIAGHATAKLRLLNGAHSALAYVGFALGETTVAGAMANPSVDRYVRRLMQDELAPSVRPPGDLDVAAYCASVLQRFRNPAIEYRLTQIGSDSSQKIPARLLPVLADNLAAGRPICGIATALAGWILFVRHHADCGLRLADPQAERLSSLALATNGDPRHDTELFLEHSGLFAAALATHDGLREALATAYSSLIDQIPQKPALKSGEDAA